jgi:hypothetical protein
VAPEEAGLYGLPLDEFIPARTELERRLRKEGDRERAAAVKKLPKPSVAAWAVNQASRSQPQARRDLLDASAELREVQERLIAREASPADLEAATARQRAAIDALVDAAAGLLTGDGKSLGDATLARVRETFAAVASDDELAGLVEAGTLDRERQPSGLGFPLAAAGPPNGSTEEKGTGRAGGSPGRSAKPGRGGSAPSAQERKQRETDAKRRERELKAAREAVKAAKADEKEAARRLKAAEREAKQAAKELERAERAAEKAREAAEAAAAELDVATASADEAARAREAAEAALESLS